MVSGIVHVVIDKKESFYRCESTPLSQQSFKFKISELGFFPGKEICYIFDFGEHWRFSVTVLDIEAGAKVAGKYKLLKSYIHHPTFGSIATGPASPRCPGL